MEDLPDPQKDRNGGNDTSVVHVPLLVQRTEGLDLLDKRSESKAEVQRPKGVSLLHSRTGVDQLSVVVQEDRLLAVTPVGPVGEPGKLLHGGLHKDLTIHAIERVAKVDLQQSQLGLGVLAQHISKGMCYHLYSAWATHTEVPALEVRRDLFLRT